MIWYAYKEWSKNVAYYKELIDPDRQDARCIALWKKKTNIHVKTYEIELNFLLSTFKIRALGTTIIQALLVIIYFHLRPTYNLKKMREMRMLIVLLNYQ